MQANTSKELAGLGGWLAFLIIGLVALGPLLGASSMFAEISSLESVMPGLSSTTNWENFKLMIWSFFAVFSAISISAGYRLLKIHESQSVSFAIYSLWLAGPISAMVFGLLLPVFFPVFTYSAIASDMIESTIVSAIHAGVWTAYLKRSIRVRNTYKLW